MDDVYSSSPVGIQVEMVVRIQAIQVTEACGVGCGLLYYRGKGMSSANGIAVKRRERSEQKSELAMEKLGEER